MTTQAYKEWQNLTPATPKPQTDRHQNLHKWLLGLLTTNMQNFIQI